MDIFGDTDPKKMPPGFFFRALGLDYSTAVRANPALQNYTVAPRHWYLDARFRCAACPADFVWSAQEQRAWFEDYGFYVDSRPTLCPRCRADRRNARRLRREYDASVTLARSSGNTEQKVRIVQIVDELESC
ncbi:MAG: hypothetical protein B9S33_22570 [Pedosphaera sp. Tous-C6FEB]|nr:MAG: hypothetical protein B9S33_22570 [Pedosphaera sp. Tous-C6FEB]